MVDAVLDPVRMPTVTLSPAELKEIDDLISAGQWPKDWLDRYFDGVDANVFGVDAKKDRKGHRIEQGLGSSGNQTQQSIDAYIKNQTERRRGGPEADFEKNVARMQAELAETNKRRADGPTQNLRNVKKRK